MTTDWIGKWAMYQPNKTAVSSYETGQCLTYGQLNQQAEQTAHWWASLGIRSGDRVAALLDFCVEYVVLFGAAQKTGVILVPLNYRLSPRELDYLLSDSQPQMVICAEKYLPLLQQQSHYEAVNNRLTLTDYQQILSKDIVAGKWHFTLPTEDSPLFILYTSGTTGFPKGAIYTHKMAFWNSINTALRLDLTSADHTVICMPPFHTGGWNVFLTPFMHHGASVTLMQKFEASDVLRVLAAEKSTIFMAVPTMLKMMADAPEFEQADLSAIRYFIVGGEPMPIPLIETWHHRKGIPIRQGFGMTEAGPNLFSLHQDDAICKKGSIGKPNFYVEVKLVDEAGNQVPTGQIGELLIKGPMVTPGYWQKPEATAQSFQGEWFCSGDLLKCDEEGYFFVMDRKKNMFISGGENVYPAEIEHFLRQHERIAEVAVIPIPHEKWGEVGKAFIVPQNGAMLTEQEVLDFCQGRLARYKIPKEIVFINELPKNSTGKTDRRVLANM